MLINKTFNCLSWFYFLSYTTCIFSDDFNEDTDDPESEGMCSIVVSLMQEHRQSRRNVKIKRLQIGFMLYKVSVLNFCLYN